MSRSGANNLCDLLIQHAQVEPKKLALVQVTPDGSDRRCAYSELHVSVARMAAYLERRGVAQGDRVIVLIPMSIELYEVLLGIFYFGAVAVFIDPGMPYRQVSRAVAATGARLVMTAPGVRRLRILFPRLWSRPWVSVGPHWGTTLEREMPLHSIREVEAEHPALLTFTSGTTGQPKGILRSHRFLLAQHDALAKVMGTSAQDVEMPVLPIFLLNSLASGATAVIPPVGRRIQDVDGALVARMVERYGVTTCSASPTFYERLLPHLSEVDCGTVRTFFLGGAPVSPRLLQALSPHLPNGDTVVVYGSTEAEPICEIRGADVLRHTAAATAAGHGLCVGKPVECIALRIEGDATAGGEVLVAGAHVNAGYFDNPVADRETKVVASDGVVWHRTGDMARVDSDGKLWLLGRKSAVLESHGIRIFPFAVEMAARSFPEVQHAALVAHRGVPTLVIEGSLTHVEGLVGRHTGVERLLSIPAMPTDMRHNAKVDYARLQRWLRRHS